MDPATSPAKTTSSLPWELIVELVSHFLDPTSLGISSCVCKSWSSSLSDDNLWMSLCLSHFPSSRHLLGTSTRPRKLFSLLYSSSGRRRRLGRSPPRISLRSLVFAIDVFRTDRNGGNVPLLSFVKPGEELVSENGVVRFEMDVEKEVTVEVGEKLRVAWMVVMKGCERAFSVMEREGKGRLVEGDGLWFSEELPAGPGNCPYFVGGGGLVAELGLGFCDEVGVVGEGLRRLGRVSLGLMSVVEWRYVSLEDGLLYLQQFLSPSPSNM